MEQDGAHTRIENVLNVFLFKHGLAVDHHFVAVDRHNFTGILVHEVLNPGAEHAGGELAAESLLEVCLVHLHLLGKVENLDDVLVALQTDGAEQRGHGQFLLAVDVGVHHIVDVGGELDP